jgi:hypothetical protein
MSLAITAKLRELEERLAALERSATANPRQLGALFAQARLMKARGDALKADIRTVLDAHKGPRKLKAFAVLSLLNRDPLPSLRRVQEVIREIKREAAAPHQHARTS